MFEVRIYDGPEDVNGTVIHHPINKGNKIDGSISKSINEIESFDFTIFLENVGYGLIKPLNTLIDVYNVKTGKFDFEGRILTFEEDTDQDGAPSKGVICEGELAYFHDSTQEHVEFRGTPRELILLMLAYHNQNVEPYKRFELGEMNVTNSTDNMYVYLSDDKSTYEELFDKLIDRLGGEFQIRKENGVRYLDYLNRIGEDLSTEIRLSKNLMSLSKEVDPTEIITRLKPLGTRLESEDEEATDASQARLTIADVNNGSKYIDREDLIAEFGIRAKPMVWDDINFPDILFSRGTQFMNDQKLVLNQYQLAALDLNLIGLENHSLEVGNGHPTINPIMSIDEVLRIVGKTIDINEPANSSYSIGDKFKTLSEYQRESNRNTARVNELQAVVNRQVQTIGDLNTAVNNVNTIVDTINIQIGEADIPGLKETISNLDDAIENLNLVVEGIPVYGLARPDYSGLMPMDDKAKIDRITLNTTIDLGDVKSKIEEFAGSISELFERVEALETPEPDEEE